MNDKSAYAAIYGAYYSTLVAFLVASYFSEGRVWGFNWWAYYPSWVPWVLFGLGALAPVVLRFIRQDEMDGSDHATKTASGDRKFFIYVGVITAGFGSLFYLLRARTHFLGDGYNLLSELAKDSPFAMKTREYGESLLHIVLKNVIGGEGQAAALLSHQIISITAGFLFVVAVALFARKLYEHTAERVLFLLGLCTGGYMLLFFGYVENYSLFVLSVLVYTLTGLLIADGKASRYWLLPALVATVFFHVLGVTLIPSAIYAFIAPTRLGRRIARWKRTTKVLAGLLLVASGMVVFYHFCTTNYFFRFAFVPLIENRFTVEGYTMFSWKHLADWFNLLFLLVPGLLIVIVSLSSRSVRRTLKQRPFMYLAILVASVLGSVFIFDPKLGMPRDWDLFSFAGVPVVVISYCLILCTDCGRKWSRAVALMCIGLSLLSLIPRVLTQSNPEIAVNRLLCYRNLDSAKCRNARAFLAEYYEQTGDEWVEQIRQDYWEGTYEQEALFGSGMDAMNNGDLASAINDFKRACEIDPQFWNSWATLGASYSLLGMTDAALNALDIAEGINPHGAAIFSNKATFYVRLGKYREAEELFLRCIEIDTSNIAPYAGLITLYRTTGQESLYRKYLLEATGRSDVPGLLLAEWGYYMLTKGRFGDAAEAYRRALGRGLDSTYVQQLIQQYPQIEEYLK